MATDRNTNVSNINITCEEGAYIAAFTNQTRTVSQKYISMEQAYYSYQFANRTYWDQYDPQLISECLYSIAIVFSFARISYILPVNEHFGPLQISLGRTVVDIYKWAVLFAMIFASFMFGLHALYSYFEDNLTYRKNFTTIEQTFITLFWSLFGLSDYRGVELAQYPLSRIIGYLLYGAYSLITVVIMLNMLIAMINNSYNRIENDSDVEWKFARSKLMLSYFGTGSGTENPTFNLI